jgi:hypothetical protein
MSIHIAILKLPYLRAILDGRKTIESRLSKVACEPFGCVRTGERLYLKASGGPFMGTAIAGEVLTWDKLTPQVVAEIEQRYRPAIGGDDDYWQGKRAAAVATLIRLCEIEPLDVGPAFPRANMKAWHVLPDERDIVRDVTLTAGHIRNNHVSMAGVSAELRRDQVTLQLPDGVEVVTDFPAGKAMLRWRGWGRYFNAFAVEPGGVVRFVAVAPRLYRVTFRHAR